MSEFKARTIEQHCKAQDRRGWLSASHGFHAVNGVVGVTRSMLPQNFAEASPMHAALAEALDSFIGAA